MIPRLPEGFSHPMRIGEGAFASVYRVRQNALERWVALKLIFEKDRAMRRELLKEAQTQARLDADCVPQIYDAFEWRERICIVMEWVRGISLATLLGKDLAEEDRLSIAGAFIRALAAIHGQGFVHRDLKPENIIISPDRGLFLVDFGFSKNIADIRVSTIGVAKGTPAYMAPELWSTGGGADLMRTDVYAAGKILLQILSSTPHTWFTELPTHEDPQKRPATGTDLLISWESRKLHTVHSVNWKKMTVDLVAQQQSDALYNAVERLLFAHRSEEAYWLLVESLEENGNNVKALDLMGNFQARIRKKGTPLPYAIFAAILLIATATAFFAGMRSTPLVSPGSATQNRLRHNDKLTPSAVPQVLRTDLTLREDTLRTDRLCGRIIIRSFHHDTRLLVDDSKADIADARLAGIPLHAGVHSVTLLDNSNRIIRNERIRLLPFQTKVVDNPFEKEPSR